MKYINIPYLSLSLLWLLSPIQSQAMWRTIGQRCLRAARSSSAHHQRLLTSFAQNPRGIGQFSFFQQPYQQLPQQLRSLRTAATYQGNRADSHTSRVSSYHVGALTLASAALLTMDKQKKEEEQKSQLLDCLKQNKLEEAKEVFNQLVCSYDQEDLIRSLWDQLIALNNQTTWLFLEDLLGCNPQLGELLTTLAIKDFTAIIGSKDGRDFLDKLAHSSSQATEQLASFVIKNFDTKGDQFLKQLTKIEEFFERIHSEDIRKIIELKEIRKIINDIISMNGSIKEDHKNEDGEASYFQPIWPRPLSDKDKAKDIYERIPKKYIGDLPPKIKDLIFYFSHHKQCVDNNIPLWNRVLLYGNPGTGKNYLVEVIAQELQVPYFSFSASFFSDKYVGESSRRIRRAFKNAVELNRPVILFIDEIDALAARRTNDMHNEHRATLITLLTEMQQLQGNKNVYVIMATNDLKVLDSAMLSRFGGSKCEILRLNEDQRARLFKKIFSDYGIEIEDAFAKRLAEVTAGRLSLDEKERCSNRDMENIVATAVLKQFARCGKNTNNCNELCHDLRQSIDQVMGGDYPSYASWRSTYCDGI